MENITPHGMAEALNAAGKSPRGRKPVEQPAPEADSVLPPALADKVEEEAALVRKVDSAVQNIAAQQFEAARVIGQMQTLDALQKYTGTGLTLLMRQMKESKAYKGLNIPLSDGSIHSIGTFEEFCEFMGTSRRKVDEDLQNLAVLGESFMESAQKIGLSYRQLRQLRALPEDARAVILNGEAVNTDDPETLKDFLEEQIAKNAKLAEDIKAKEADLTARDRVLSAKNKALDDAQTQLAKLKTLDVDAQAALAAQKQREALAQTAEKAGLALEGMVEFFAVLNAAFELPALNPHIREHLEGAANSVAAGLADMFANRLDWKVDFAGLVYPEWMESQTANARQQQTE